MQTFKLVSPFEPVQRRSFDLAVPATLRATDARPMVGGEWLQLNDDYQMVRGGDGIQTTPGTMDGEATVPSYAFFGEPGRTEMQALGKGTFLFLNPYEADTMIFDGTGITTPGQPLSVWDINIGDGIIRRGLGLKSSGLVVGYVTRIPSKNNSWLRFRLA
jgi:hypothetical protein